MGRNKWPWYKWWAKQHKFYYCYSIRVRRKSPWPPSLAFDMPCWSFPSLDHHFSAETRNRVNVFPCWAPASEIWSEFCQIQHHSYLTISSNKKQMRSQVVDIVLCLRLGLSTRWTCAEYYVEAVSWKQFELVPKQHNSTQKTGVV
jgi:hypothetical protein